MENYLKTYHILNDNSILTTYDLTFEQVHNLMEVGSIMKEKDQTYIKTPEGKILIIHQGEEGGLLYNSLEDFKKVMENGFKSHSIYFDFNPSYEDFLKNRFKYIDDWLNH